MNIQDKRLVLVSNAEPYAHRKKNGEIICEKEAGGLTSALDPLMQKTGGLWIAWGRGGKADFDVVNPENKVKVPDQNGYTLKRMKLSKKEVENFYLGFSNRVLWPISHSFPEKSSLEDYKTSKQYWETYQRVNKKYAEAIVEEAKKDDLIWIHDYHLSLVPKMVKEEIPEANIGFFWHIPWAPWEMFGNIPWNEEIMNGLIASDFIGFHTHRFKDNFLSCAQMLKNKVNKRKSEIVTRIHNTKVFSLPLGIEYDLYNSLPEKKEVKKKTQYLKEEISAEKIIVSVDRLDYTKGIPQRLRAFELFLKKNPEFRRKVTLVQRIPPSRRSVNEYQSILNQINQIVGEINGKLSRADWTPIMSFHRYLPTMEELIPYYLISEVALVTPLIDGMNLVCKEYIASSNNGALVLSQFAGASEDLEEAILVNPYNAEEVAQAIKKALMMPQEKKKVKLEKMKEKVRKKDLKWWRRKFLTKWLDNSSEKGS